VLAGAQAAIDAVRAELDAAGIKARVVNAKHGFHSALMDPVLAPFEDALKALGLNAPQIPVISNVTGEPLTAEMAMDPEYWSLHVRSTVRFGSCMSYFEGEADTLFLELGPGRVLSHLAVASGAAADRVVSSAAMPDPEARDDAALAAAVGAAWEAGIEIDWAAYFAERAARRVALPGYPFDRERAWLGRTGEDVAVDRISVPMPKQIPEQMTQSDLRATVTEVWQSLLGCETIEAADDFFTLGGDSMLLVRVQQAFDRRLKLKLTLADLYQAAGFESLVALLSSRLDLGAAPAAKANMPVADFMADVDALMARAAQIPSGH